MKKYLITGGSGFIGTSLVLSLLKNKKNYVLNLDNFTYAGDTNSLKSVKNFSNYDEKKVDISDKVKIESIIEKFAPDFILNLAAESHVDRSINDPSIFIKTNIFGTYSLLEGTRKYLEKCEKSKISKFRFLHVSTDEVFGDLSLTDEKFDEDTGYNPSSPYSASKASSDHLVRAWQRTYEVPTLITNCSNNYGPYQFPEKLIPLVITNALECKKIPMYGDGSQIRDWIHVEDHVSGILKVLQEGKVGETYLIGSNNEKTNSELINSICLILDEVLPIKPESKITSYKELIVNIDDRPGHDLRYAINSKKIAKLGWEPTFIFKDGLKSTIKWYIDNEWWWKSLK